LLSSAENGYRKDLEETVDVPEAGFHEPAALILNERGLVLLF